MRHIRQPLALRAILLAGLALGVACQNELPPGSSTTAASSSADTSTSSSTLTTIPPTLASINTPLWPPATTYMFLPFPSPTPVTPDSELIPVTPANPLPVQDPLNGPWLVPDFTEAWGAAWNKSQAFIANLTLEQRVRPYIGKIL
jgi:hypothetical protein